MKQSRFACETKTKGKPLTYPFAYAVFAENKETLSSVDKVFHTPMAIISKRQTLSTTQSRVATAYLMLHGL